MTSMTVLLLIVITVRVVMLVLGELGKSRDSEAMMAPDDWEAELRRHFGTGDWEAFAKSDSRAWHAVDRLPREDAFLLATRLGLLRIEYGLFRRQVPEVLEGLATVRKNARELPLDARMRDERAALALATLALDPAAPDPELLAIGEEALAGADDVRWTRTRERLVQAAVHMARVRRAMKEHEAADRAALQAIELCAPRDLEFAHVVASIGALEAALHYKEAGDDARAAEWFDRAEGVVEPVHTPACRARHGLVLLMRNMHLPGDTLLDAPVRRRRNQAAVEVLRGLEDPESRKLSARALANLGQLDGLEGRHREAAEKFAEAVRGLVGIADPDAVALRVELRIACGQARLAAEDPEGVHEFQLAMDEAAAAEEPDTRAMALTAAFALHPMHAALGMFAGAAEVLRRAAEVAASLPGDRGRLAVSQVELERARAAARAGRPVDARNQLRALLTAVEDETAEGADGLRRLVVASLGHAAFGAGDYTEAVERFERALAMEWPGRPEDDAERAELEWHLATALFQLDRARDARAVYARAFERGRGSGLPAGRYASAQSAFQLAEQGDLTAERRQWFAAAVSVARLCGTAAGDQLAERATERLKELAGG